MRPVARGAAALVLALAAGCAAGGQSDLSGAVTLDGLPLDRGAITLTPIDPAKGAATGGEVRDGRYALTGVQAPLVGSYKVSISATRKSGRKVQKALGKPGELDDQLVEAVAPRFNTKTTLAVEVKPGGTTADFAVTSK